jgi:ferritin-like metal-binding protein YciE
MEVFVLLLSQLRSGTERSSKIYQELSQAVQEPRINEAIQARNLISTQILSRIDEAFKLIGKQPVQVTDRFTDLFVEDFRKEVAEIQSPEAKRFYVLAKLNKLAHLRVGAWEALIASADMSGNFAVGVLLETCLADKLAFAERTRRLIHKLTEAKFAERAAA